MVVQVARIIGFLAPSIWALLPTEAPPPVTPVPIGDEFLWELEVDLFVKTPPPPPPPPVVVIEEVKVEKPQPKAAPKPAPKTVTAPSDILNCIAKYESGGNYGAVNPSGKFRGRYQMDTAFWLSNGGDPKYAGRHEQAPAEMQDAVARNGIATRGLRPWPTPSKQCAHLL